MVRIAIVLVALTTSAQAQTSRLDDHDIRCTSVQSCNMLIGRRLWVKRNNNEICATARPATGCRKIPPEFGVTVEGVEFVGDSLLDRYFRVRTQDGKVGYVNIANSHLLTFTDPKPAQDARKKKQAAEAEALAAIPKENLEKACILAAAEKLPRIPGIAIKSSRTFYVPPEPRNIRPDLYAVAVEIVATAAGQTVTYRYACAVRGTGPALVKLVEQE